ncbi:spore germination protein KA/spore germination protein [Paenibacillus phyllosphaerae]|uniref:Spore germination protein KA/spore germination protein n=1 Tax=Paenibacillus phyllosphaerae TaxID=274593 RepID=A0A7W5AW63_9BACL|nr:spore germination protein [Paenibacillus phyllosphaerae]MBB3109823.1 spore germination protein KA/spore germination protein [Paenibacillus phyllosphaerae]
MANPISTSIEVNARIMQHTFNACSDLRIVPWQFGPRMKSRAFSIYFDTIVLDKKASYFRQTLQDLLPTQLGSGEEVTPSMIATYFSNHVSTEHSATLVADLEHATSLILSGSLVIFIDGWDRAISYKAGDLPTRQVGEPVSEPVVQGPREATVEQMKINIGMIRGRVQSPQFKIHYMRGGGLSRTMLAYGYVEGTVDPNVLSEFQTRMKAVKEGDVLETSYVESLIEDSTWSPFPQFRYTERTDVAAAAVLGGKIAVFVEGTGSILICPGLFFELLQSSEDYYQRTLVANMIRWMRMIAFFLALVLPSLYIALSTFHTELIPTVLLLAVLDSREGIPFPAFVEAVIMVFFFELLREAGIRLPRPVGSAVSIVGALVVGEAAINAGIASPIMVVVIALTGIASFSLPQYNMAISLRLLQLPLMGFAALLGGFGLMIGYLLIWNHLIRLKSLGVPYLQPVAPWIGKQNRDTLLRKPLKTMFKQTKYPSANNQSSSDG